MRSSVLRPPGVSKPDIVPFTCQLECGRNVLLVENPSVRRAENAVLKKDSWLLPESYPPFLLYSEHVEDIPVFGLNGVTLIPKAFALHNLLERFEVIAHYNWHQIRFSRVTVAWPRSVGVRHLAIILPKEWDPRPNSRNRP